MSTPMDIEAKSLMVKYKHHIQHEYHSAENQLNNATNFRKEFDVLAGLPIAEFSPAVWDDLNDLFNGA